MWGYASLAQSAERDRDMVEAAGAEPAGRTSYLDMILVNGEATGAPDKRVAGGAVPPTRPKQAATASSDYLRTRSLKPEWRGSGLLTRWPVDRNHSRPPKHIEIGPVTVAAERAGLLSRQLKAHRRFESCLVLQSIPQSIPRLYPNWQRECVESAFSGRSSRPRRTNSFALSRSIDPAPLRIW